MDFEIQANMFPQIIDQFTTHLRNVLARSMVLASEQGQKEVTPLHLLWTLLTQEGSIAHELLKNRAIDPEGLVKAASRQKAPRQKNSKKPGMPVLSSKSKLCLERAIQIAGLDASAYIGTEHLLNSLLTLNDAALNSFLAKTKVNLTTLKTEVSLAIGSHQKFLEAEHPFSELQNQPEPPKTKEKSTQKNSKRHSTTPALDYFSVDLTSDAAQDKIDPVVGREKEIDRMIAILARRTKNNPLLLGEPGVGKTAIVEGLAKKILRREVPAVLLQTRILALDLPLMIAGTMYRGEFEARLKQVIEEAKTEPNIMLFIDELHTIVGAGASSGSLDAGNILKPALARGDLRLIGATTLAEYKKHLEADAALERRFQSIVVEEPAEAETLEILQGVKGYYEDFHNLRFSSEALREAVKLSERFLEEKKQPDKSLDLLDETAARLRSKKPLLKNDEAILNLAQDLEKIRDAKHQAILEEQFIEAEQYRAKENDLKDALARAKERNSSLPTLTVEPDDILTTVELLRGLPLRDWYYKPKRRIATLLKTLNADIQGQAPVIAEVQRVLRRAETGLAASGRPLASFLFAGPTGVGKTETARSIARALFADSQALLRLDMSEFSEPHTVSKLLGAPAGYVGFREEARLSDALHKKSHQVVLFDEFEKAHADIQNLLLQILEEGSVTDALGRRVSFKNAVVILTTNVGAETGRAVGFAASKEDHREFVADLLRKELRERFRPELVNRLDKVCVFSALDFSSAKAIAQKFLNELEERSEARGLEVSISPKVAAEVAEKSFKESEGARSLRRGVEELVETPLVDLVITHPDLKKVKISLRNGMIVAE
ncbi:MAG: ATP-dependent Clp protease ATP-binding subunit [bacterium]